MARPQQLPTELAASQVIQLGDALLSNADRLLKAALRALDDADVALARSLAILGMEESGKAIALHQRRIQTAYAPEGQSFVDRQLQELWGSHVRKLETVHQFLVDEEYWFGVEAPDPSDNQRLLGTIEEWTRQHNSLKQRGFYVDVSAEGDPIAPAAAADADAVREAIGYVHQIGWQLRLGEHIEGKRRLDRERDVPPASEDEIASMRKSLGSVDAEYTDRIVASMRRGVQGTKLNNAAYAFTLPENSFDTVGQPGYEAQDRELFALMDRLDAADQQPEDGPANSSDSVDDN